MKRRERYSVAEENVGERGGHFSGSYSGCHKCGSQAHFSWNCAAKIKEDRPQKKKFKLRRYLDDSDDESVGWIKEVDAIIMINVNVRIST